MHCYVSDWQHWMEGKRTTTKTDSELALNAVRESLTTRKTADQSTSLTYVNTDSSVPASETEVRLLSIVNYSLTDVIIFKNLQILYQVQIVLPCTYNYICSILQQNINKNIKQRQYIHDYCKLI